MAEWRTDGTNAENKKGAERMAHNLSDYLMAVRDDDEETLGKMGVKKVGDGGFPRGGMSAEEVRNRLELMFPHPDMQEAIGNGMELLEWMAEKPSVETEDIDDVQNSH